MNTSVGYVSRNNQIREHLQRQGVTGLDPEQVWRVVAFALQHNIAHLGAIDVDWLTMSRYSHIVSTSSKFKKLLLENAKDGIRAESGIEKRHERRIEDPGEKKEYITRTLTKKIAGVLGIPESKYDILKPLDTIGFDSLLAVELAVQIEQNFSIKIPKMTLLKPGLTTQDIIEKLATESEKQILTIMDESGNDAKASAPQNEEASGHLSEMNILTEDDNRVAVICPQKCKSVYFRLICFSYLGGNPEGFVRWQEHLPEDVELCIVRLPGRSTYITEKNRVSISDILQEIITALLPLLDTPFCFYGHSLGANLAFSCAEELYKDHRILPLHLFLGGSAAPGTDTEVLRKIRSARDNFGKEDIIELLGLLDIPDEFSTDNRWLSTVMPGIHYDINIIKGTMDHEWKSIPCPITLLNGTEDTVYDFEKHIKPWENFSSISCVTKDINGKHLFIDTGQGRSETINIILNRLYYFDKSDIDINTIGEAEADLFLSRLIENQWR